MFRLKKKLKLSMLLIFAVTFSCQSQDCSCSKDLDWLITTFENNDAGFQYAIDIKGEESYLNHNLSFQNASKAITTDQACHKLLIEWTKFFRNGHVSINRKTSNNNQKQDLTEEQIRDKYQKYEKYDISINDFYMDKSRLKNEVGYEGIWQSGNYKIGIVKDKNVQSEKYIGFILEADGVYWHEKQIKLKLEKEKGQFIAKFYMQDHSERLFQDVALLDENHLKTNTIIWKRVFENQNLEIDKELTRYIELAITRKPIFKKISDSTLLFRIPSFQYNNKKIIDSILAKHHSQIISHKNLIIDIRNNGGGSDSSYENIIPYLYTNPIQIIGLEYLSTPLNNSRMNEFINNPDWEEEDKEWARKGLRKLNENLGKFVNIDGNNIDIEEQDTIYQYPKNIAILINEGNGSTSEQFLLAAKQSKKVKLFGETTHGVLDISNMHFVDFPCENFRLGYGLSKSMRMPEMAIDGKGVQPDYFIHKSIPLYKWINYAENILN